MVLDKGRTRQKHATCLSVGVRGVIVATTLLSEVYYVLDHEKETDVAKKTMKFIVRFENLDVLPVTSSIAIRGAQLRRKYYSQAEDRMPPCTDIYVPPLPKK